MLGDFIHNLRCALDYVIVACVPKHRRGMAGFPIVHQDIFVRDENGKFVVKDARQRNSFESCIEGLPAKARAIVIGFQPYQAEAFFQGWDVVNNHIIGIISRLENADKHRNLIAVGCGGREFKVSFIVPDLPDYPILWRKEILASGGNYLKDNTEIPCNLVPDIPRMDGSLTKPSEVNIQFTGTAQILIRVPRIGGNQIPDNFILDDLMGTMLSDVRAILKELECFACH